MVIICIGSLGLGGIPAALSETRPEETAMTSPSGGTLLLNWLEEFLPIFVEVFADRLYTSMQGVGETDPLTRTYTEEEFRRMVLQRVEEKFSGKISDVDTHIHPDGFVGTGKVHLGDYTFPVMARIGVVVVDERAHAVIREVRLEPFMVTEEAKKLLELRVNQKIDQKKYPLKIKRYELREGAAVISVDLTQ